jgi:putative ATP-dependent endonuclease of OLD family
MSATSIKQIADPARSACILRLLIERFRGIPHLSWQPANGLNVVLGGGDVGKTSILDAIGLLLSPTNPSVLADTDYYGRDIAAGFVIEADLSLPPACGVDHQLKPSWPWHWNGKESVVPQSDAEITTPDSAVYRLRVRGTEDLELWYEIVQPDGSTDPLSVALRRSIGLVRLSGDDRNDRDLRLVQGSALDRLLGDKNLRSRIANELAKSQVKEHLTPEGKSSLGLLDAMFHKESLPDGLDLAITGSPGASIASMIGLTALRNGVPLPLASWGAGTRRLSALAIAEQNQTDSPIVLVDEVERGLEPYRQRLLVGKLQTDVSQGFITTHSPAVISAATEAAFWYIDHAGHIGPLDSKKLAKHRANDPNTFLSRLTIIGEGITEVGFVRALLAHALGPDPLQYGIHVSNGGGNEATLDVLEALAAGGLRFGCFADEEGHFPGRWRAVVDAQGPLAFRWASGCLESNLIAALSDEQLSALIDDPQQEKTGRRLRTLQERLGTSDKQLTTLRDHAGAHFKAVIIQAATGDVPDDKLKQPKEYKAHARDWFKTEAGGRELEGKLFSLGLWPAFRSQLLPFCNAVRQAVSLPALTDLADP